MYDVLIVGGGSAGCVLANRLSAEPGRSVVLLEAGPDYASVDALPADIADAAFAPQTHDWGYVAEPDELGVCVAVPRGKVIGGSSSTNYCFAMRARPADHDAWAARGNPGWAYEDMLPFYRAMESCAYGADEFHGRTGPYRIVRYERADLSQGAAASVSAGEALGFPLIEDVNAPARNGVSLAPLSVVDGVRESTAIAYLNPARGRGNLTVRGDSLVDRVLFDGQRAIGVVLDDGEQIRAHHVVLSAGTYNTPTILMRSGVGPAEHLEQHGVEVVVDSPGVGQNLMEHPVLWNIYSAKRPDGDVGAMFQISISARSGEHEPDFDLHVNPTAVVPTTSLPESFVAPNINHPTGWDLVMFVSCVQPLSRGSVRLRSARPADTPLIDLGLYADDADADKVADAVRLARQLCRTTPLSELIVAERVPGPDVPDKDLPDAVRRGASHYNHACGTARMGPGEDPHDVVNAKCMVHGVDGLSIVDASIFPVIPRVPTNLTVIVVAERAATFLCEALSARVEASA